MFINLSCKTVETRLRVKNYCTPFFWCCRTTVENGAVKGLVLGRFLGLGLAASAD
jgi:hypothetical protein